MPEKDLKALVRGMHPKASTEKYYFALVEEGQLQAVAGHIQNVFCACREAEGISLVLSEEAKDWVGEIAISRVHGPFALISIGVESDLLAVGLLAKITAALAREGMPANAISAYKRDYLLVPHEKREEAVRALAKLSVK